MAWTAPKSWGSLMVTHTELSAQIKDNLTALSTHNHSGSAGAGSASVAATVLSSQNYFPFADQSANPSTAGRLQRNGSELLWYDSALKQLTSDAATSVGSARTLGTGSTQAAAGNHTH